MHDVGRTEKTKYPHISQGRMEQLKQTFLLLDMSDNNLQEDKGHRKEGINAPFEKFSLLKSDGYHYTVSGNLKDS